MWWTLLVARFFDVLTSYFGCRSSQTSLKWKLKGAYPCSWLILSAVMLNLQFVGVACGPYWSQSTHISNPMMKIGLPSWIRKADRVPPDPIEPPFFLSPDPQNISNTLEQVDNSSRDAIYSYGTNILYESCQKDLSKSKKGALVDRGANGGLAGSDVRAIHVSSREVDVQGIDNHRLTNIPIVTAAGVVDTQKGPVVLIMNQYAHVKHGKTIHSAAQLEANGLHVDDCAIPNGGHQRIITQGVCYPSSS